MTYANDYFIVLDVKHNKGSYGEMYMVRVHFFRKSLFEMTRSRWSLITVLYNFINLTVQISILNSVKVSNFQKCKPFLFNQNYFQVLRCFNIKKNAYIFKSLQFNYMKLMFDQN